MRFLTARSSPSSDGTRVSRRVWGQGGRELRRRNSTFLDHKGNPTPTVLLPVRRQVLPRRLRTPATTRPARSPSRLPKGTYYFDASIDTFCRRPRRTAESHHGDRTGSSSPPESDSDFTVYAREGTQPSLKVDRPGSRARRASELGFGMKTNWGGPAARPASCTTSRASSSRPSKTSWPKFELVRRSRCWPSRTATATSTAARTSTTCASPRRAACPPNVQRAVPDRDARPRRLGHALPRAGLGGPARQRRLGPVAVAAATSTTPRTSTWHGSLSEFTKVGEWPEPRLPVLGHVHGRSSSAAP